MNETEQKLVMPLIKALQRLERSKTKLTRRNALLDWGSAIRDVQSTVGRLYPRLRKDGSSVIKRPVKGRRCPRCRVPVRSVSVLVSHLMSKHGEALSECPCGWRAKVIQKSGIKPILPHVRQKAKHLGGVRDLDVHYAKAAIIQSANRNIGSGKPSR